MTAPRPASDSSSRVSVSPGSIDIHSVDMDQRLQSGRRGLGRRARLRGPCLLNYARQIPLAMLMRHDLRGALALSRPVLPLPVRVTPPRVPRRSIAPPGTPQTRSPRRARARRRAVAAATVADPAQEERALAALALSVDQVHVPAVAAGPVDLSTGTCESG